MLKRTIKSSVAAGLYYSGALSLHRRRKRQANQYAGVPILMYHRVIGDDEQQAAHFQPGMCVTRTFFERQMTYLARHYRVISLEKLISIVRNREPVPPDAAVVTFDDGWRDNYDIAFPVMKAHGITATIFLATNLIDGKPLPQFLQVSLMLGQNGIWPRHAVKAFTNVVRSRDLIKSIVKLNEDHLHLIGINPFHYMRTLMLLDYADITRVADEILRLGGLDAQQWRQRRWMLTWDEAREMAEQGIEFGSHGQSHDLMINVSEEQNRRELAESKRVIESHLGRPVPTFAYPNGDYTFAIKQLVRDAGYAGAAAVRPGDEDLPLPDIYAFRRVGLNEGATLGPFGGFSKTVFACLIEGIFG